ncbi:DMT family transporter [Pleionea sp. CnH1-48]|uniref:DMT family transporter n=1 Tax=Pleionea sp. CnH1-48 TaxID=2954494 RepID=UPI0020986604|nr:EamA family transporter [Pleionea sp. CnH1-48]MCO7225219.1 EamA family transporter [Pleionea sp. CnH1-48]
MKSTALYILTVLIWGSTWLAIEFQLGEVAVEASLIYRFALSALIMWAYCWWKKLPMTFSARDHGYIVLLAAMNFSLNYLILYWAQTYLSSAMTSIAFSTMLLMNIINTRLFFGKPIAGRIYLGAIMGVMGIVVLFWPDLQDFNLQNDSIQGLLLVLTGTLVASLGNMVSVRNSNHELPILQVNAWGMFYGTLIMLVIVLFKGTPLTITSTPSYWISLLYLSIFGSVIAFACYFLLLKDIGPEKASYSIVLFPLVAVVLSSLFEDFRWEYTTIAGFSLVILGNVIVLTPMHKLARLLKPKALKRA